MPPERELARLRAGLQALQLWPRDEERQQVLASEVFAYLERLQHWNRRHNLTAVRDPAQMLVHHVLDCAAVVPVLRSWVESRAGATERPHIIDVGSGAGLPGIVLAWFWPEARITLVEPAAKRIAFLQQASATAALANVQVVRARVEELASEEPPPDAIICRAFSSLADFVRAVAHLAGPDTVLAAMKARLDESEKQALTILVDDGGRENRMTARHSPGTAPEGKLRTAPAAPAADGVPPGPAPAASPIVSRWEIAEEVPLQVPELDAHRCLVRLERVCADAPSASVRRGCAAPAVAQLAIPDPSES